MKVFPAKVLLGINVYNSICLNHSIIFARKYKDYFLTRLNKKKQFTFYPSFFRY